MDQIQRIVAQALPSRELLVPVVLAVAAWAIWTFWDGHAIGTTRRTDLKGSYWVASWSCSLCVQVLEASH